MRLCFECSKPATEKHRVIPVSRGGTQIVWLCSECHGKVHDVSRMSISALTKEAIAKRKAEGLPYCRTKIPEDVAQRIRDMRNSGMTYQAICDTLNAENVPTARGAAEWRTQSIPGIVGYIRPSARETA